MWYQHYIAVILLSAILSFSGKAETLKVALYTGGNPPYTIIENNRPSGIFIDIFDNLSKLTSHKFEMVVLPTARVLKEFDYGLVDIEPGVNEKWRQHVSVKGEYSISYSSSTEVLVFKPENMLVVNSPEDLYGKKVGIVRGYSYPLFDKAFDDLKIYRIENVSEINLLKQLMIDRLSYIFIGYRTMLYYQQQIEPYRQFQIGDIVSQVAVKMRIHPSKAHILPELNIALQQMIDNGEMQAIHDKYK